MAAPRFAPITSVACCGRNHCAKPSAVMPQMKSQTMSLKASRVTASARRCACRKRSGLKWRPTGNFGAAPTGGASWSVPRVWKFGPRYSSFATIAATSSISLRPMRPRRFGARIRSQSTSSFSCAPSLPSRQRSRCRRRPRCTFCGFPTLPTVAPMAMPIGSSPISSASGDPDALVERYIVAINGALTGCSGEVIVGIHMCRGNFRGRHLADGGYEWVAERFFARADANHFLLEYDTPRAGDFAPLRFVPKGKGVVLGLISSKTPVLETIDSLQRRIDEATKYIATERLAISPQCGFASSAGGNPLTEADERAKLRLAVDAAHAIWR